VESTPQVEGRLLLSRLLFATVKKSYHKSANLVNNYFFSSEKSFFELLLFKKLFCFALLFLL